MATAATLRDIARRLESEVARHGCGLSCDLCQDVEEAILPAAPTPRPWLVPAFRVLPEPPPERASSHQASVKRTGEYPALPEGIDAQEAATFAGGLPCY